jgi:hypothetical protein
LKAQAGSQDWILSRMVSWKDLIMVALLNLEILD